MLLTDGSGANANGTESGASTNSTASAAQQQLSELRATSQGVFAALAAARSELGVLRQENEQLAQRAQVGSCAGTAWCKGGCVS